MLREFHCSESVVCFTVSRMSSSSVMVLVFVGFGVFCLFSQFEDKQLFAFHLFLQSENS